MENLEYIKFSKLIEYVNITEKEGNIKHIFDEFLWKEVLSKHPKFKDVFEDGKKSFIKQSTTFKKIIIALSEINFDNYDFDILGEAYESIFVDAVFGAGGNKKSELGQFFTPPKVKKLLVSLVNPKIKSNGNIESIMDPASGTGGILNTVIKHYKKLGMTNEVLSQQLINNIYGMEIKGKIFNLCLSNMLINTGEILPNVICADSIRKFHNIKVDNIVANPPFSVTINYDELLQCFKVPGMDPRDILDDYIPIKTGGKNSEILFLQMMIHCLNINGKCATVMLDGQKMYGNSSGYDTVREYLMKSCDLQEVILCPSGTFTSTASKTCILFFIKKKDRKDVVEITEDKKRLLKFCKSHSTKKVKFYDFNPDSEEKHFIKEVDISEIASKNYSLNYTEYGIEEEKIEETEGIEWMELGKVCEFKNGQNITKEEFIDGDYYVVGGGLKPFGQHNKYNVEQNTIIISKDGAYAGFVNKYNTKIFVSNHGIYINKFINVEKNYIYYYLKISLQNDLYKLQSGAAQPGIKIKNIEKLKVPILSIEKQTEIVNFLDGLFSTKYNLQNVAQYYENNDIFKLLLDNRFELFEKFVEWQDQSTELSKQIEFYKNRQSRYLYIVSHSDCEIKTLGEVCTINIGGTPRRDNPDYWTNATNVWVSVRELNDNIIIDSKEKINNLGITNSNVKLIPKNTILFSFKLSIGKIAISGCDLYTNEAIAGLIINDNKIIMKYLYYSLKELNTFSSKGCIGNGSLNKDSLGKIKIPVPSLEKQTEIIKYCEYNDSIIKQLEKDINENKQQSDYFISNISEKNEISESCEISESKISSDLEVTPIVTPKKIIIKKNKPNITVV